MKIRLMSNGLSPEMREDNIVQLLHLSVVLAAEVKILIEIFAPIGKQRRHR
jgi:hypothetical protein